MTKFKTQETVIDLMEFEDFLNKQKEEISKDFFGEVVSAFECSNDCGKSFWVEIDDYFADPAFNVLAKMLIKHAGVEAGDSVIIWISW